MQRGSVVGRNKGGEEGRKPVRLTVLWLQFSWGLRVACNPDSHWAGVQSTSWHCRDSPCLPSGPHPQEMQPRPLLSWQLATGPCCHWFLPSLEYLTKGPYHVPGQQNLLHPLSLPSQSECWKHSKTLLSAARGRGRAGLWFRPGEPTHALIHQLSWQGGDEQGPGPMGPTWRPTPGKQMAAAKPCHSQDTLPCFSFPAPLHRCKEQPLRELKACPAQVTRHLPHRWKWYMHPDFMPWFYAPPMLPRPTVYSCTEINSLKGSQSKMGRKVIKPTIITLILSCK